MTGWVRGRGKSASAMPTTRHSGDGKANQYFLRGFNLGHGADGQIDRE